MDLTNLSSDVASTSSAAPLDVARTILDPVSKVARNSYDVFICHRGPDTKASLVDLLRAFLQSKGIDCFVDYQMEEGVDFPPTLNRAIRNSKVHIIVLSPRFAESPWCLNEVEEIMEMQKDSKAKTHVLPIFFNVEPRDVRHHLFQLHQNRTNAKIHQWSEALADLAKIKGFIWATNGSQGQMIEKIVSRVDECLRDCTLPLNPDSIWATQIMHAEQMLCLCNDDNVVSIGVRGIDKSGFAMELYKKLRHDFPAACILQDVKGKAKCKEDLIALQMILLKDLVGVGNIPPRIHNTDEGLALLLDRLKHVKCFIVLDDIENDDEQLRSLLVLNQHQLCRGSRLVLTSHYPHIVLDTRAQVKATIHLQHIGTEGEVEGEVEERRKCLAICWESNDVHEGFIDHLSESLSMLGLDVSEMKGLDLLNWAYQKQADVILVILSRCFVADSILMQGLNEASRLHSKVKFVPIYYGLHLGRMDSLQTEIPPTISDGMLGASVLSPSLSKRALQFSAEFESTNRFEYMEAFKSLINNIVLNHMQHEYKMNVTKFPVGLSKRQVKLESQIRGSFSNGKVNTFCIVGMGGIGKTTLAKSLYNRINKEFEGAIFMVDVATNAKEKGLESLQETLVRALGKDPKDLPIKNVEEDKAILTRTLYRTHILVILDDINCTSQLDALLSPLDLDPRSVVVVTTRDRSILDDANWNHYPYEMEHLDQKDAERLFYWHAFLKPFPPKDLEKITKEVIDACGGLPLSLEVIGAHVSRYNDPADWNDTLKHLKKAGKKIFEKLRVSVDALEIYQREAFLDVCCFLVGKRLQTALRIWDGCGWAGKTCERVLKSKCLITVDPIDGTIGMHDQIRDMGRYIADMRTPRTHIWDAKGASDIPQGGIDDLRGFAMISQEEEYCEASDLATLRRVKVLLLHNLEIIGGDFSKLPRYDQIRWLQWQKSPFMNLPPGLYCSEQLCVLDLSGSEQLETLWGSSQSGIREVPDQSLQELNLRGCFRLRSLPDTIEGLRSLEKLYLEDCESLDSLPEGIGRCSNLIEINLSESGVTNLPESIRELRKLEILNLSLCEKLVALPDSMGALNMLRECPLSGCESLQQLPESFGELTSLTELYLDFCKSLRSLPDTIEGLRSLEKLYLQGCESLDSLPEGIGRCCNLIEINLSCSGVSNLPESIGELRKLEELYLSGCGKLVALPDSMDALNMLRVCPLRWCESLQQLPESFCELTSLTELYLDGCKSLRSLPDTIEGLRSLETLDLSGCESLDSLPEGIGRCCNLIEINLSFSGVRNLPESIGELRKLELLILEGCEKLVALPDSMGALNMLRECRLMWCESLQQLPESFGELTSLTELDIRGCKSLRSLPDTIEGLHSLERLYLSHRESLKSLPEAIGRCRNLEEIWVEDNDGYSTRVWSRWCRNGKFLIPSTPVFSHVDKSPEDEETETMQSRKCLRAYWVENKRKQRSRRSNIGRAISDSDVLDQ